MELQQLGQLATILSSVIAVFGIPLVVYQVAATYQSQRRSALRQLVNDYLSYAVQYPRFAYPEDHLVFDFDKKTVTFSEASSQPGPSREALERYEWFLSKTLFACSEMVAVGARTQPFISRLLRRPLSSDEQRWREIARLQLGYHGEYLAWRVANPSVPMMFVDLFGKDVTDLVNEIAEEYVDKHRHVPGNHEPLHAVSGGA